MNTKTQGYSIDRISFYAALCFFLATVEYAVPKPLPFMRLGLANIPILIALKKISTKELITVVALKIFCQAIISGTMFSYVFIFSLCGSAASAIAMILIYKLSGNGKHISFMGLSMAGALANTLAQILCSSLMIFGDNTKYIAPVLLITGLVTSVIVGFVALSIERWSSWYSVADGIPCAPMSGGANGRAGDSKWNPVIYFVILALFVVFLFVKDVVVSWIMVAVFYCIATMMRKKYIKLLPSIILLVSIVFFALLDPYGKVLFAVKSLRVTEGALRTGLRKSAVFIGMTFVSKALLSVPPRLPGRAGEILGKTMSYFCALTSGDRADAREDKKFSVKRLFADIDERMLSVWRGEN